MAELIQLDGIGRKTASVVLGVAYRKAEGIVVDTHVARLSRRLGLTRHKAPEKIERSLMKLLPRHDWIDFSHLLIWHGRQRCSARKPDCAPCELRDVCPQIGVGRARPPGAPRRLTSGRPGGPSLPKEMKS
jgi:endonuclease-3